MRRFISVYFTAIHARKSVGSQTCSPRSSPWMAVQRLYLITDRFCTIDASAFPTYLDFVKRLSRDLQILAVSLKLEANSKFNYRVQYAHELSELFFFVFFVHNLLVTWTSDVIVVATVTSLVSPVAVAFVQSLHCVLQRQHGRISQTAVVVTKNDPSYVRVLCLHDLYGHHLPRNISSRHAESFCVTCKLQRNNLCYLLLAQRTTY